MQILPLLRKQRGGPRQRIIGQHRHATAQRLQALRHLPEQRLNVQTAGTRQPEAAVERQIQYLCIGSLPVGRLRLAGGQADAERRQRLIGAEHNLDRAARPRIGHVQAEKVRTSLCRLKAQGVQLLAGRRGAEASQRAVQKCKQPVRHSESSNCRIRPTPERYVMR